MADTFIRHTRRRSIPNLFSRQSGTDHDLFCRTIIKPPAAQNKCDADPISSFNSFSNLAIPHGRADRTTDEATSHSAKPQSAGQAAGYSHSTDKTTSHPTKQPKDGCQVVGYKLSKVDSQVTGYQGFRNKSSSGFLPAGAFPETRFAANSSSMLSR